MCSCVHTHTNAVWARPWARWAEVGVSVCVRMSAKQSISLLGDSSWSLGRYRTMGKLGVTAAPPCHLLDMDLHTLTTPTRHVLQGPIIISGEVKT